MNSFLFFRSSLKINFRISLISKNSVYMTGPKSLCNFLWGLKRMEKNTCRLWQFPSPPHRERKLFQVCSYWFLHCSASFPEAFQKKKVSFFLLLREWKEIISSYLEILKAYGRAHTLVCSQCSVDKSRFGLGSRMTQARFRGFTFALPQPALTCRPNLYFSCCNSAFSSFSPPPLPALVPIHTSRIFVHFLCTYP